jgi:hypothetical protein
MGEFDDRPRGGEPVSIRPHHNWLGHAPAGGAAPRPGDTYGAPSRIVAFLNAPKPSGMLAPDGLAGVPALRV